MLFAIERASQRQQDTAEPPVKDAHWDDVSQRWVIDIQSLDELVALAKQENPRWHVLTVRAAIDELPDGDIPFIEVEDTLIEDVTVNVRDEYADDLT